MPQQKGAQSIRRTVALLRAVARHNDHGARLSMIAREEGLHVATARRILGALVEEGLITHDPSSKFYHLGIGLYLLGQSAHQFTIRNRYRSCLDRLAQETGDTIYLIVRSGNDALCIDRVEGHFPIRIMTYDVGARLPLGIGTAGLAYLAALPDDEVESVLKSNTHRYARHNDMNVKKVRALVSLSRRIGYTSNEGNYLKGATGVGQPIYDRQGSVVAAVSVTAIADRMDRRRQKIIADLIKSETAVLDQT